MRVRCLHLDAVDRSPVIADVDVETHAVPVFGHIDGILSPNVLDLLDVSGENRLEHILAEVLVEHDLSEDEVVRNGERLPTSLELLHQISDVLLHVCAPLHESNKRSIVEL